MKNTSSDLEQKSNLVRKWCLVSTTEAGSGHPTSCLSAADLATVLFDKFFTYDIKDPKNPNNDRFVLSKGHAAPLLYTLFAISGAFSLEKLRTLRKLSSNLEGHPTPRFPYAEAATGSLGQGLSIGAGIALSAKKDDRSFKTYVLLGDGEMAEGSVWEAANFASHNSLDNLIAIVDVNRLAQSDPTMFEHRLSEYSNRFSPFGWEVVEIDGHNFEQIEEVLTKAQRSRKPFVIVAKTKKGKGVSFLEDKNGWHGKALKKEELEKALEELGEVDEGLRFALRKLGKPKVSIGFHLRGGTATPPLDISYKYKIGDQVATREVYGQVLAQLANDNPLIYALDGDVKNSTYSQDFKKAHPERFIECFIAEQNMVGVALGLSSRGKIPFVSTFASFLTRAFDQVRMAAISKANMKFVGSHAGVSIGEDGPSQMGLEDIAMFGSIPESVIFHPSDAVSCAKLIAQMVSHVGISYLRTLRPKTAILYNQAEEFQIGGSKVLRKSDKDVLTVVACGITVHEALAAYEELKKDGINIGFIDCYCVKPIDQKTLKQCGSETLRQLIITVEDHYFHGGLGDMVLNAVANDGISVIKLAVSDISRSGKPEELLELAGISTKHIVETVKKLLAR